MAYDWPRREFFGWGASGSLLGSASSRAGADRTLSHNRLTTRTFNRLLVEPSPVVESSSTVLLNLQSAAPKVTAA